MRSFTALFITAILGVGQHAPGPTPPLVSAARATALKQFGCRAPAPGRAGSRWHALAGSFREERSHDLVVVCVRSHNILVVFFGTSNIVNDSLLRDDVDPTGQLFRATPSYIVQHLQWCGSEDSLVPKDSAAQVKYIRHDGVGVIIGDCCSAVYYRRGNAWVEYPGAD